MMPQGNEADVALPAFRKAEHQNLAGIQEIPFFAIDQHDRVGKIRAVGTLDHKALGNPVISCVVPWGGGTGIDREEIDLVDRHRFSQIDL